MNLFKIANVIANGHKIRLKHERKGLSHIYVEGYSESTNSVDWLYVGSVEPSGTDLKVTFAMGGDAPELSPEEIA